MLGLVVELFIFLELVVEEVFLAVEGMPLVGGDVLLLFLILDSYWIILATVSLLILFL